MKSRILILLALMSLSWVAQADLIRIRSDFDAARSLDRLEGVLKARDIKVFARVRHSEGAKTAGFDMPDTELLVFGKPEMGTPLMLCNREAGLDLPMRVLAYTDSSGDTWLAFKPADELLAPYALGDCGHDVRRMMDVVMQDLLERSAHD